MQEIYQKAAEIYKQLSENSPSQGICRCAVDIVDNGIMEGLTAIARKNRNFGSISKRQGRARNCEPQTELAIGANRRDYRVDYRTLYRSGYFRCKRSAEDESSPEAIKSILDAYLEIS